MPPWKSAGSCARTTVARAGNWPRAAVATLRSTTRRSGSPRWGSPRSARRPRPRSIPTSTLSPSTPLRRTWCTRRPAPGSTRRATVAGHGRGCTTATAGQPGSTRTTRSTSSWVPPMGWTETDVSRNRTMGARRGAWPRPACPSPGPTTWSSASRRSRTTCWRCCPTASYGYPRSLRCAWRRLLPQVSHVASVASLGFTAHP